MTVRVIKKKKTGNWASKASGLKGTVTSETGEIFHITKVSINCLLTLFGHVREIR